MDFETFVSANFVSLSRVALVATGNRQDAHDVLVEALIRASLRWNRISRMSSPVGYVRRMVVTEAYEDGRRRNRRAAVHARSPVVARGTADPATSVVDRDRLLALLQKLPTQQRIALGLRFYLDLPDAEIATYMGCSASTVRTHVSRGMSNLRTNMTLISRPE